MKINTKYIYYIERSKKYLVQKGSGKETESFGYFSDLQEAIKCRDENIEKLEPIEKLKIIDGQYVVEKVNKFIRLKNGKYSVVVKKKTYGTFKTIKEARRCRNKLFGRQYINFGKYKSDFKEHTIHIHIHSEGYPYYNKLVYDQFRSW